MDYFLFLEQLREAREKFTLTPTVDVQFYRRSVPVDSISFNVGDYARSIVLKIGENSVDFEEECDILQEQLKKTKEQNDDLRELIQNLKADLAVAEIELDHYRYQEE